MDLPVMPPVSPMLAKAVAEIPPGLVYEPKLDGFRSIVFRDGDEVEIGSRNERPMSRYFPEVVAAVTRACPPRCVVDGEIVVAARIGGRSTSGRCSSASTRPRAASRLLAAGRRPGSSRSTCSRSATRTSGRGRSASGARRSSGRSPRPRRRSTSRRSRATRRWPGAGSTGSRAPGWTGSIAKRADDAYQPGKRVMAKIKHVRTADCVLAGYRRAQVGA